MIMVLVEHFLTEEGRHYFPSWIRELTSVLNNFPGFISLQQIRDVQNDERSLLVLRFQTVELLKHWAKSEAHDLEIAKLHPYMEQKQRSEIFEVDESNNQSV